ncbi:MAG: transglutaminase domain-containing protein [Desulfobacterales bacterium]|nr:transglutaminase domain-containing protein [Desulfobacterales bacterium]MBF0398087.1 transglutaminase domain-containing protein [Desulfobacterales bacterium]
MKIIILSILLFVSKFAFAENYLLNGGQESQIRYQLVQRVMPAYGTSKLMLSYIVPVSFASPTYNQKIENLNFNFSPRPTSREERFDDRGNKIIEVSWEGVTSGITATIYLVAKNSVKLSPLKTSAAFPLKNIPEDVLVYLNSTEQAPSNNSQIKDMARELTSSANKEFDAVQRILSWIIDHMRYVLEPPSYDAMYSFATQRGNCQNYSHLAASLMRAVGIPVRIVNGVTLNRPYDIKIGSSILTMKMAQGRHSWIEVFFTDLGWVPFDPQGSELFVSNRFIRGEIGIDNNETNKDGLVRWTTLRGEGRPEIEESIEGVFDVDNIKILGNKTNYGPREMLLSPVVNSDFSKIPVTELPPIIPKISDKELKKLKLSVPFLFGNLEFPENVNFLEKYGPAKKGKQGIMEMHKKFLVETAEYVTTQGQQYAQTFILKKPLFLKKAGIALHAFNNDGQIWLELYKDKDGKPDEQIATSDFVTLSEIKYNPGYKWVDFDFSSDNHTVLSPGRYWIALGFTGGPILNWFFTYGKPVGPQDGTKYKLVFDDTWSRSLSYEFNYRVVGLTSK